MTQSGTDKPGQGRSFDLTRFNQFANLPADTIKELTAMGAIRRYQAGQTISEDGDHPSFIGFVNDGILRLQKTLLDGRQHIVGLMVEGDMFGKLYDGPLPVAVEAATDANIIAFPRAPFEALLLRAPELDRIVMMNVLNELDRARDWMIILGNPRIRSRVAGFLLFLCTRFATVDHLLQPSADGTLDVKVPISRTDMAHLLGTRTESLSRAFHALADQGWITIERPDLIKVLDIDALAEEAGDEEAVNLGSMKDLMQLLQKRAG